MIDAAMIIKSILVGAFGVNCWFVANEKTRETIIIDPGDEARRIISECEKNNFAPAAILLTHGHFDHILAAEEVKNHFKIPVYAFKTEAELLYDPATNASEMVARPVRLAADRLLADETEFMLAGFEIKTISTPGHTAGSCCYYFESENALFTGDTLFKGSYGRTDLPTGNQSQIEASIKIKLFALPDAVKIYPGHGGESDIGTEKKTNMILK